MCEQRERAMARGGGVVGVRIDVDLITGSLRDGATGLPLVTDEM